MERAIVLKEVHFPHLGSRIPISIQFIWRIIYLVVRFGVVVVSMA